MDELVSLLERWRCKSTALGITGMLLYKGGNLMQAMEGEEETVRGLYATIRHDPRHCGVITLTESMIPQGQFGEMVHGFPQPPGPFPA